MKQKNVRKLSVVNTITIILIIIFLSFLFTEIFNYPFYLSFKNAMLMNGFLPILLSVPIVFISNVYLYKLNIRKSIKWGTYGMALYGVFLIGTFLLGTINAGEFPFSLLSAILGSSSFLLILIIYVILIRSTIKKDPEEFIHIKKTILKLGTRFTRLKLGDLAEKCKVDKHTIENVIIEMINNKEIYADYFESSKSVSFNQQANIDEVDSLMELYDKWEGKESGKKV